MTVGLIEASVAVGCYGGDVALRPFLSVLEEILKRSLHGKASPSPDIQ